MVKLISDIVCILNEQKDGIMCIRNEKTLREVRGLTEAVSIHNLKEGLILTMDQEEVKRENEIEITILPVWKWLLK